MKKLFNLLLALVLGVRCLSMIACKKEGPAPDFIGTYKFVSMVYFGDTYVIGDEAPWGDDILSEDTLIIVLKKNKTMTTAMKMGNDVLNNTFTWTETENGLTFPAGETTGTVTFNGNLATYTSGPIAYVLQKV